jgi:hypothetical protein
VAVLPRTTRAALCVRCLGMISISITVEDYEAVKATLREGVEADPPQIDERGGVRFLVDRKTLDRLTALRGPGESYSDIILRIANANS